MSNQNLPAQKPLTIFKQLVNSESVQKRFRDALGEGSGIFTMAAIDLFSSESGLQECDPNLVMAECMKAAALKLPISKSLGFAYVVPFKKKGVPIPTFIPGYKGLIQLAMRTGQYRRLNADCVYEGEIVKKDRISGDVEISGKKTSDKATGYFAHMELINGFKKTIHWTREETIDFAKSKCPSYKNKYSAWFTDEPAMCIKTVLRSLLTKWAPMSIDFITADSDESTDDSEKPETIDITPPRKTKTKKEAKTVEENKPVSEADDLGPGY